MKTLPSPFRRFLRSSAVLLAALPLAATADVTINFDTDLEGIVVAGSGATVEWSPEFGGSLAYTAPQGFKSDGAKINLLGTPALQQEYQNALAGGGSVTITANVKQSGISGTSQPTYFEGLVVANTQSTYDQEWSAANGVFSVTGFPLAQDYSTTFTLPIVGVASGAKSDRNSTLEFNTASTYAEIILGLNSGPAGTYTGGTVYISKIVLSGTPPPPPPKAGVFTFETTRQGFEVWPFGGGGGTVAWSSDFGGSLKLGLHNSYWNFQKAVNSGTQVNNLKAAVERGGTLSFDVIGPVGKLASKGFSVALQSYNGYFFSQVDPQLDPATVVVLPDGVNEIGRITVPTASFPQLLSGTGFNFAVGYNPVTPTPVPLYIDNVLFAPYSTDSAKLTFDNNDPQNFVEIPASGTTIFAEARGVSITNPADYAGGASATFTAGSADPQVVAVYNKLLQAAVKGGILRYKVRNIQVLGQTATFGGFNVDTAFNVTGYPQSFAYISKSALTEGGDPMSVPPLPNEQTGPNYSQAVETVLRPEGSTATGGFVLPQNAGSYEFQVKSGYAAADASEVSFIIDDFEVIVNDAPEIVYTPALPTGSAGFVGRVLSTAPTTGTYSATGLPPGVVIDPTGGLIHGTPTTNGTYNVVFSVTRAGVTTMTDAMAWEITGAGTAVTPKITSFSISGTTAVLNWSGTGAAPINVERSISLAAGSWSVVSPGNTTGTFTDTSAPVGKAFYRLAVP